MKYRVCYKMLFATSMGTRCMQRHYITTKWFWHHRCWYLENLGRKWLGDLNQWVSSTPNGWLWDQCRNEILNPPQEWSATSGETNGREVGGKWEGSSGDQWVHRQTQIQELNDSSANGLPPLGTSRLIWNGIGCRHVAKNFGCHLIHNYFWNYHVP